MENKRRQRQQAERALEKQQRRQQQEQKTSSSSSSSTSSSSSNSSSMSSPPAKSSSPPTSHPAVSMVSSSSSSSTAESSSREAVLAAARLLQQRQQQQRQQAQSVSRPQTLKTEPPSPTWSQIEHLIPKLSPTQPQESQKSPTGVSLQQQQQQQLQFQQQQRQQSQQRAASLKRQMAFDLTTALQESVQQQLQEVQSLIEEEQPKPEPPRLQSQLSIPESVSSFILSSEFSDSGTNQYEFQQPPQHHQATGQYQSHQRSIPNFTQRSNQPQLTASQYVAPPNFLHIASSNSSNTGSSINQRTFNPHYITKAKSDPLNPHMSSNFLSMESSPSTCSASLASVPNFFYSQDVSRSRSLSNPSTMYSAGRQLPQQMPGCSFTGTMPYSDSIRPYQQASATVPSCASNTGAVVSSSVARSGPTLGLFTGNTMLPTTLFAPAGVVESESPSSSDETVNEQELFQFSVLTPHKRTLSDPVLHGGKVRKTEGKTDAAEGHSHQQRPSLASPAFFSSSADEILLSDPRTTLKNLTTTRCFSSTRTSNTPSPSPSFGLVPMGVASPSPTPSCSSGSRSGSFSQSSPAPKPSVSPVPPVTCSSGIPSLGSLPSLSSLYDTDDFNSTLSPASHAAVDTALDIYSSAAAARGGETGFPGAGAPSSANLQASIELIPEELYPYLTDIQESRGDRDSSILTPMGQRGSTLTQNPQEAVNLPDIDELLGNREGSL